MSRLQELHPDQQAVLQLVLRRRLPYADLAGMLGLTPEGVRERALDAVDGLAPEDVEGLALEDRDRIADHLLGQDEGADRAAAAALIAEHPPAGRWAGIVAAELGPLGGPAVAPPLDPSTPPVPVDAPERPAADAAVGQGAADPAPPAYQEPADGPVVHGGTPVSEPVDVGAAFAQLEAERRGRPGRRNPFAGQPPAVLGGTVAALVVLVVLALWIGGAFGGGDDESSSAAAPPAGTTTSAETDPAQQRALAAQFVAALPQTIRFRPPASASGRFAQVTGTAKPQVSAQDVTRPALALTIQNLPAPTASRRYFLWADKNGADPVFLGQLSDPRGAEVPFEGVDLETRQGAYVDPTVYSRIRLTVEGAQPPTKPGRTVIVGTITPRTS